MSPILRFVCLLTLVLLCSAASRAQVGSEKTLLWKISGNGLDTASYLYGTMHVQDRRAFDFADSVLVKFQQCSAFAAELEMDTMMTWFMREMKAIDTSSDLKEQLSAEQYQRLEERLAEESGISLDDVRHSRPWVVRFMLSRGDEVQVQRRKDRPTFLDAYLYRLAKLERKETIGLEAPEEQMNAFDDAPLGEQVEAYLNGSTTPGLVAGQMDRMIKIYHDGDLEALHSMMKTGMSRQLYRALLTDRNVRMADRITSYIRTRPTFIAIGAGHLPGDDGVIELLRARGFDVTPVKATRTGLAKKYKEPTVELQWHKITVVDHGITVEMPSAPVAAPTPEFPLSNPFATAMMDAPQLKVAVDITSGQSYILFTMQVPPFTSKARLREMERVMADQMADRSENTVLSRKTIDSNGMTGYELSIRDRDGAYTRLRSVILKDRVVIAAVHAEHDLKRSVDVDRFFSSLSHASPVDAPWTTYRSDTGAYSIEMPGERHETDGEMVARAYQPAMSLTSGSTVGAMERDPDIHYLAYHLDLHRGRYDVSDSASLQHQVMLMARSWDAEIDTIVTLTRDSAQGVEFRLSSGDSIAVIGRVYVRGTRAYGAIAAADPQQIGSSDVARFLGSMKFHQLLPSVWREHSITEAGMRISAPVAEDLNEAWENRQYDGPLFVSDAANGQGYEIERRIYPRYFHAPSQDSLFARLSQYESYYGSDSLVRSERITVSGYPGIDIDVASDGVERVKRVRMVLAGDRLYKLAARLPVATAHSAEANRFFDSFTITDTLAPADLYTNKTKLLLADLVSDNEMLRDSAAEAVRWYELDSTDLPLVYRAIREAVAGEHGDAAPQMFRLLSSVHDSTTVPFIREALPTFDRTTLSAALTTLGNINSKESVALIGELVNDTTRAFPEDVTYLFSNFNWNPRHVRPLFPGVIRLLSTSYRSEVMILIAHALDSGVVESSLIEPHRKALLAAGGRLISDGEDESYARGCLARILGVLPKEEASVRLLRRIARVEANGGATWARVMTASALLEHDEKVERADLDSLAVDTYYRVTLYRELDRIGKLERFPEAYRSQRAISESLLYERFYDLEDIYPDTMAFVASRVVTRNGGTSRVYLFKYREEGETRWHPAIGGLQPSDGTTIVTSAKYVTSDYVPFDETKIDEQIEALMTKAEEEEKERKELDTATR